MNRIPHAAVALLAVAGSIGLSTQAVADPPPPHVNPNTVAAGRPLHALWLSGLTIHDGRHGVVHVPVPTSHAFSLHLLGRAGDGRYVLLDDEGADTTLMTLSHGHLSQFRTTDNSEGEDEFLLAPDGSSVVEVDEDFGPAEVVTYDLTGGHQNHAHFPGSVSLLAYDGHTAWLSTSRRTFTWVPGQVPVQLAATGSLAADPTRDLLWADAAAGLVGPTSLATPGVPRWTADFTPVTSSPDGQYVGGVGSDEKTVEIRRMSDGSLVSSWLAHYALGRPMVWDRGVLAFGARTGRGSSMLGCAPGGDCVRVTPIGRYPVSVAFTPPYFGY
jgi:hypothetical protein